MMKLTPNQQAYLKIKEEEEAALQIRNVKLMLEQEKLALRQQALDEEQEAINNRLYNLHRLEVAYKCGGDIVMAKLSQE